MTAPEVGSCAELPGWMNNHCYVSPGAIFPPAADGEGPITAMEVEAVLQSLNVGSSAGSDGLSYGFWKGLDRRGLLLADLF